MPGEGTAGRPIPVLLLALLASFALMILSGVFYGLGMPEDWARALFMGTVVLWVVLGLALVVKGERETRTFASNGGASRPGTSGDEDGEG